VMLFSSRWQYWPCIY